MLLARHGHGLEIHLAGLGTSVCRGLLCRVRFELQYYSSDKVNLKWSIGSVMPRPKLSQVNLGAELNLPPEPDSGCRDYDITKETKENEDKRYVLGLPLVVLLSCYTIVYSYSTEEESCIGPYTSPNNNPKYGLSDFGKLFVSSFDLFFVLRGVHSLKL